MTGDQRGEAPARLPGVDVLRGLSVLLVVMHHIHLRFVLERVDVDRVLPKTLNQVLFWSGYYAVIVFFVISGFLITGLSMKRWGRLDQIHVGRFYRLRLARIVPSLLLLLLLLAAFDSMRLPGFTIAPERASLGRALLAALTFHVNWLEGHHGYLPGGWDVLWSLSVEETFYLTFPLACVLLRSERLLLAPLALLMIAGPVSRVALAAQDPWGDYAYLSCMDGIAFGCLAALVAARIRLSVRTLCLGLAVGAALAISVLALCNEDERTGLARFGLNVSLLELGIALMLVAFAGGIGHRAMSVGTRWLRRVGQCSYEVYLFHMLVVLGLMDLFTRLQPPRARIPLWYAAALGSSLFLGYVVSRYYSEPLNRYLRARRRSTP